MPTDHYRALGVLPDADAQEIRAAYLRLMRSNHPDRRPGDPVAADTARRVNAAYHVLGDRHRRGHYDQLRRPRPLGPTRDRAEALRAAALARQVYSAKQHRYRQTFTRTCQRVGAAIVVLGTVVLLSLA